MEFFDTIRMRHSTRHFKDDGIPECDLRKMLEAATLAPSATNDQPWHFIVIQNNDLKNTMRDIVIAVLEAEITSTEDKARIKRLSNMRMFSTHFANAPAAIAVLARPWAGSVYSTSGESVPRDLGIESASMASNQLLLAATDLGYGSCYSSAPAEFARVELEAVLDVNPPWFLLGIISLGITAKIPQTLAARKPLDEVTTFI